MPRDALAIALRKVAADPDDARIPQMAERLSVIAALYLARDAATGGAVGMTRARETLREIARGVDRLSQQLAVLGSDVRIRLEKALRRAMEGEDVRDMLEALERLSAAALAVDQALAPAPQTPGRSPGRPPRAAVPRITREAAVAFEGLTGRPPTRVTAGGKVGGLFVEFLGKVFGALDVEASADNAAKTYLAMERIRTRNA